MNQFLALFKTYFKNRKIPFYVALGAALLSFVTGIVYIACLGSLEAKFINIFVCVLPIVGAVLFLFASLFKQSRLGAIALTGLDFASLIVFAISIYEYPLEQVMVISNIMDIPHMTQIIVIAVLFLVSIIIANVVCWLSLEKETPKTEEK